MLMTAACPCSQASLNLHVKGLVEPPTPKENPWIEPIAQLQVQTASTAINEATTKWYAEV